jgi:VWFA-related protein
MRLRAGRAVQLLLFLACGFPSTQWAAQPVAEEGAGSASSVIVPAGTARVGVDLVLRDKQGALVRDLRQDEVEVLEDGVPQAIESFGLIDRTSAAAPADTPVSLALAFDHLGPAARRFARAAALDFLGGPQLRGAQVGVFSIDRGLSVLQPFTDDAPSLRRAVEAMTAVGPTTLAGKRERELTRNAYHGLGEGLGQAHVAPAEMRGAPECRGREEVRIRLTELLESRLVEGFESLERDQQGFASAHALLALIGTLGAAPGRKALVLFSEGLAVPANVAATYQSLVGAANRARVSVYTVDAGGLRVESPGDELRRTLDTVKTRVRNDTGGGRLTEDDPLTLLEKNEDALHLPPESTLRPLADQTGGFAIAGTNDPGPGLARLEEELGTHFVLSYTPSNRDFDGRFRQITVRVRRPYGSLQARKGYLAVKTELPVPALAYEAPALARLESAPPRQDLPLRLRGLQFPEQPEASLVPILVELPSQSLRFERDEKARLFRQDFTILALVRDSSGRVVAKASQRYPLQGALDRLDEARRGSVLFYREVRLPPGRYTLEAVALDAGSGRVGTARAPLEVPRAEPSRLRASSLMVVARAEKVAAGARAKPGPLQYRDVLLYPDLGARVRSRAGRPLAFFVSAWPAPDRPGVDARVQLLRSGKPVAAAQPFALPPGTDGRIELVSTVAVDALAPGPYELRVTLSDGRDAETRSTPLAIGE